jgi:phosphopantothenoylcysteine decarboxylase/phosphopantothenate--cysteine ligase
VALADPAGVRVVRVETAVEMLAACVASLPADVAVFAAAVADWRVEAPSTKKLKKEGGAPASAWVANPDILAVLSVPGARRPRLTVGFAAETDDVAENAAAKRVRKGCDWIVANDVRPETGIMGGAVNQVSIFDEKGREDWPLMGKEAVAEKLVGRISVLF